VPGAKVTFTVPASGASRSVVTGEDGRYLFQQILAGSYEITVTKEGFKTARQSGIEIQVNESARADIQLEVGSITATVRCRVPIPGSSSTVVTGGFIYLSNPWSVSPWPYQLTWAEVGSQIPVDTKPSDPNFICREFIFQVPTVANIRSWDVYRPNLANPVGDVASGAFGQIQSTVTGPRILQFGMKLQF
jgi:hypothetical protein